MIEIRIIGTDNEIKKALDCLKQDYQIGSVSELYPTQNYGKFRCYIRAAHKKQCKLCHEFNADEEIGVCPSCLATMEDD